jgi:hypothetical protein
MKMHSAAIRLTTSSGLNIDAIAITSHGRYSAFSAYYWHRKRQPTIRVKRLKFYASGRVFRQTVQNDG